MNGNASAAVRLAFLLVAVAVPGGCTGPAIVGKVPNVRLSVLMPVDGVAVFHARGTEVWLEHVSGPLPGMKGDERVGIKINGTVWHPEWTGRFSNRFAGIAPEPMRSDSKVVLKRLRGRGPAKVLAYPQRSDDQTLKVIIDDSRKSGAGEYLLEFDW